eukprot:CAMPEP_0185749692 /NCGR_PEP_ID=MMETSP1174-20130828/8381_1 /TAXON_ID=35687 /ORGANISM="Dictyocha speculum, Strain CCMP1381" /LENGTH=52 /DNA_ID=CAMNT_0028425903 /DNA_START=43 /DNA_END=198 /DNA_ORIENTATION=+
MTFSQDSQIPESFSREHRSSRDSEVGFGFPFCGARPSGSSFCGARALSSVVL